MAASTVTSKQFDTAGRDHARIVQSVADNVFAVLDELGLQKVAAGKAKPVSMLDVAAAIGRTTKIDKKSREVIERGAQVGESARSEFEAMPAPDRDDLRAVALQVYGARSLDELEWSLTYLDQQGVTPHGQLDLKVGARLGLSFLEHGRRRGSIYDPDAPFWRMVRGSGGGVNIVAKKVKEALGDAAKADAGAGISTGVVVGAKLGPEAGLKAGLAAGALASASSLIESAFDMEGMERDQDAYEDFYINWHPPMV